MIIEPKFKKFNWFIKLITFNWPLAVTLSPFGIYVNQKFRTLKNVSESTKTHEIIHWKQQLELLIIFFYIWYLVEWFIKTTILLIKGKPMKQGYYNISFEREAYGNENNIDYLKNRKNFTWIKYIFNE